MAVTMARDSWTDERLDDLNAKVDHGFEAVDRRFGEVDRRFEEVNRKLDRIDRRFEQFDARFDALQRTLINAVVALCGCMITGFAGVIALLIGG
jgi:tetrahydromethanopterin S-methyltransferase subunit G